MYHKRWREIATLIYLLLFKDYSIIVTLYRRKFCDGQIILILVLASVIPLKALFQTAEELLRFSNVTIDHCIYETCMLFDIFPDAKILQK